MASQRHYGKVHKKIIAKWCYPHQDTTKPLFATPVVVVWLLRCTACKVMDDMYRYKDNEGHSYSKRQHSRRWSRTLCMVFSNYFIYMAEELPWDYCTFLHTISHFQTIIKFLSKTCKLQREPLNESQPLVTNTSTSDLSFYYFCKLQIRTKWTVYYIFCFNIHWYLLI